MTTITAVRRHDVRFPTSLTIDGSDAMNKDGDYSAAYVVLRDRRPRRCAGYGLHVHHRPRQRPRAPRPRGSAALPLVGPRRRRAVSATSARCTGSWPSDSQLRWLGPEKGVVHLAMAAVMNAVWDLAARRAGKPLWRLLADMTPEELVDAADLRYLSDVLTRDEALAMLREHGADPGGADRASSTPRRLPVLHDQRRLARLRRRQAAPAAARRRSTRATGTSSSRSAPTSTTTSAGCAIAREVIGWDANLMIDANQVWDVPRGDRVGRPARRVPAAVDRGADQPRRRPRPRRDPAGGGADRRGHRRARDEPGAVQADVPGRRRSTTASSTPPGWPASTRSSRST